MYRINIVIVLYILIIKSTIISSCDYCQIRTCNCSLNQSILNCSSYLLNLTYVSNCVDNHIWKIVDFSSRNFDLINRNKLLSLRMERLLLKSNLITYIEDSTFDYLGEILIELDFENNQLSDVSSKWLNSKLITLKILNLALNQLESLNSLDRIHFPHLEQLNLSCNQLSIFPQQIQQWTSLIKLDLSANKLSYIPEFAFKNLQYLSWLSLASNRELTCINQYSFKSLKSLKYLDLSSTNLMNFDGCIFFQLSHLQIFKIERVLINCSSCWLSLAKKNSIELFGECLTNVSVERLNSSISNSCLKTSIDCSINSCQTNLILMEERSENFYQSKTLNSKRNRTLEIILGVIFSLITLCLILMIIIFIYRWKKGKKLCCYDYSSKINRRMQHQKQFNKNNSTIIESIITHGANMNDQYTNQSTENTKRKLYNPMFADFHRSDIEQDNL